MVLLRKEQAKAKKDSRSTWTGPLSLDVTFSAGLWFIAVGYACLHQACTMFSDQEMVSVHIFMAHKNPKIPIDQTRPLQNAYRSTLVPCVGPHLRLDGAIFLQTKGKSFFPRTKTRFEQLCEEFLDRDGWDPDELLDVEQDRDMEKVSKNFYIFYSLS